MPSFRERIRETTSTCRILFGVGATLPSIALYPFRRRLAGGRTQIDLRNGLSIVAPPEDRLVALLDEIWIQRCYAGANSELAPGDTIVDIGAHVGVFTLWAMTTWPKARIVALEPSPRTCSLLRDNVNRNGLKNVTVIEAACGGRSGRATLFSRGKDTGNSLYGDRAADPAWRPMGETEVVGLDDLFERCNIRSCALLKLDCEGAEYEALFNTSEEIFRCVRQIALEYHTGLNEHTPEELASFLAKRGFEVEPPTPIDSSHGYLRAKNCRPSR